MDIAICTSYREGTPKFLIEAISCGLPVIASNVAGCRDVCKDNYNGYLYEFGNDFSLRKKIYKLLNLDKYQLNKLSNNSIKLCRHKYDINFVINSYLKCLN